MRLAATAHDALTEHAQAGAPEEVVGVLVGDGEAVDAIERAENVAEKPTRRYAMAPEEQLELLDEYNVCGFYHSHPRDPPVPSSTDERLATWPGYVYLIVSLAGEPSVQAWEWTGEQFRSLSLTVAQR